MGFYSVSALVRRISMAEELEIRRYEPRDKNAVWRVHERAFRATLPRFFPAVNRDLRTFRMRTSMRVNFWSERSKAKSSSSADFGA